MHKAGLRASAKVFVGVVGAVFLAVPALVVIDDAHADPVFGWDPGFIISDAVMYNSGSMSANDVATFIATQGSSCNSVGGSVCLKDYRETTPTRSATVFCPGTYWGVADEPAYAIISKVATACGINPQVLLVTLQKEQSLITTARPPANYAKALGFGCPDSQPECNPAYSGFGNQVYSAASRLKQYAAEPHRFNHRAGTWNKILYHPNEAACGSSQVFIHNQATASLYNYTPYQPNAAAIAAGTGIGDGCSAYGNRNFYNNFRKWFGDPRTGAPVNKIPLGSLDSVVSTGPGQISVSGWAFDPDVAATSSISVQVRVDGVTQVWLPASAVRADVNSAYQRPAGSLSGYSGTLTGLSGGQHQVCIVATNAPVGENPTIGCQSVTVRPNAAPMGALDSVVATQNSITVSGWAFDTDSADPAIVHVYLDGVGVIGVHANGNRPDVGEIFKRSPKAGYTVTIPANVGSHQVCVYAINVPTGPNPTIGCRNVNIVNAPPIGALDVVSVKGKTVSVAGWAFDPDVPASSSISVAVYSNGVHLTTWNAKASRADVNEVYRRPVGSLSGYSGDITWLPDGKHNICVYALNQPAGNNTTLGCKSVEIQSNQSPIGALDTVVSTGINVNVAGWAYDPDVAATGSINVMIYSNGVHLTTVPANRPREDVNEVYRRPKGSLSGYSMNIGWLPVGNHNVCVYAVNSPAGTNPLIGCKAVRVG